MSMIAVITAIHLAALSQIESGDNDHARGAAGEVSRYQITPQLWECELWGKPFSLCHPEKDEIAREVATSVWYRAVSAFRLVQHRDPTLPEMYLLWHRPGRVLAPHPKELDRAKRFENLFNRLAGERKSE